MIFLSINKIQLNIGLELPLAWPPVVYVCVCVVDDDAVWALGVCTFQVRRERESWWRGSPLTCVSVRTCHCHLTTNTLHHITNWQAGHSTQRGQSNISRLRCLKYQGKLIWNLPVSISSGYLFFFIEKRLNVSVTVSVTSCGYRGPWQYMAIRII